MIYVSEDLVGPIIGRAGANVREWMRTTDTSIRISTEEGAETPERKMIVNGTPESQLMVQTLLYSKMQETAYGSTSM